MQGVIDSETLRFFTRGVGSAERTGKAMERDTESTESKPKNPRIKPGKKEKKKEKKRKRIRTLI